MKQTQGYQIKWYLLCTEVYAVCTVMAQCVYRVNPGLTGGDSEVLTGRGGSVSAGRPRHGSGSVWDPSESPALSGWPKHCLMGLLEAQSEWRRFRGDLTLQPVVLLFMYVCWPSKNCVYENSGWLPIWYELRGRDRDSSSERTKRTLKDKDREKMTIGQTGHIKKQDSGCSFDANVVWDYFQIFFYIFFFVCLSL